MDLYNWLLNSSSNNTTEIASTSARQPPEFLKVEKTAPQKTAPTPEGGGATPETSETLTPLELRLKDIVLSVYSDRRKSKSRSESPQHSVPSEAGSQVPQLHTPSEPRSELPQLCVPSASLENVAESKPKPKLTELYTADTTLSQCDLSVGPLPSHTKLCLPLDTATLSSLAEHKAVPTVETVSERASVNSSEKRLCVRSTPDGSDSPDVLTISRPEQKQATESRGVALYSRESDLTKPPPSQLKDPQEGHLTMSDAHSIASADDRSSSAPIFSADDQNVDLVDPDFPPISPSSQLGSLPYSDSSPQHYMRTNGIGNDVSSSVPIDFLNSSSSIVYSFTDPSTSSLTAASKTPRSKDTKAGIVNSFGIPPQLFQPRLAKPRQLHSVPPGLAGTHREGTTSPDGPEPSAVHSVSSPESTGRVELSNPLPDMGPDTRRESKEATPTPESVQNAQEVTPSASTPDVSNPTPTINSPRPHELSTLSSPNQVELSPPLPEMRAESKEATPTPASVQDPQEITQSPDVGSPAPAPANPQPTTNQYSPQIHPSLPLVLPADSATMSDDEDSDQVAVVSCHNSDMETASMVSVQQLTETYLNELQDPLPDTLTPLSEGGRVPFLFPSVSSSNPPPPKQVVPEHSTHSIGQSPRIQTKLSQHVPDLPSPGRLPAHINPSANKRATSDSTLPRVSSVHSTDSDKGTASPNNPSATSLANPIGDDTGARKLEDKLLAEKKARIFLEGQLEAVKDECEAALQERPILMSKLSKAEAQLADMAAALERERNKPAHTPSVDPSSNTEAVRDLKDIRGALEQERQAAAQLRGQLREEQQKCRQLGQDLEDTKQTLADQETGMVELTEKFQKSHADVTKKSDEAEELACKLASLEAGYSALEENKSWLHDQLQEAQKTKLELQAELRDSKASGIAHDIKCDQLQKENAALQGQISDLLKGVLQDKAKMVNQLETIREDMVSNEDLYTELIAEKAQLEDVIQRKNDVISQLNSELAKEQVGRDEHKKTLDQLSSDNEELSREVKELQRANKSLLSKLSSTMRDFQEKDSDLKEVEKIKSSLQSKLRQTDAEAVGKEGTIQSLKDAHELLKHELALVSEAREGVERENAEIKSELAMLETELKVARGKCKEKDVLLTSQHSVEDEKEALQSLLVDKDREIEQKDEAIKALESQTNELLSEFSTLQDNFQSIASASASMSSDPHEKDRVISHLAAEKDRLEDELGKSRNEAEQLQEKLEGLQHERAQLLGKVEGAVEQEDYKKALQDKAQLQDQLNALRVEQKRDEIKALSKATQLEGELKSAQKAASKAKKDLEALKEERSEEVDRSNEARQRAESSLKETKEKLQQAIRDKEKAESLLGSVRPEQQMLELLKSKCERLNKHNDELTQHLQEAVEQKAEVEKASGMVVSKLKEVAERDKHELVEKSKDLSLEVERLRGRLAGMHTTQATIRDHAASLELTLAKKEFAIVQLSAESQKVLEDKSRDERAFEAQISSLETQLRDLESSAAQHKERVSNEKIRADELERQLKQAELVGKQAEHSKRDSSALSAMKDKLSALTLEKDALQSDVSYQKSQLLIAKTAAQSAKRQIADKNSQVEILERELKIARCQTEEAEEEVRRLKEHLSVSSSRQQRGREGRSEGSDRRSMDRDSLSSSLGRGKEPSLSTASGLEDTDHPVLGEDY